MLTIAAGRSAAVPVCAGHTVRVIDLDGGPVGDLFAFMAGDPTEYLSASHTRAALGRMFPGIGESFVTNRRQPILVLEADDSPGVHDMLIAACDPERYRLLGALEGHRSCASNLAEAYPESVAVPVPQPCNLFMTVHLGDDGTLRLDESPTGPGDSVTLRAVRDCTVVLSACPQDMVAVNRGSLSRLGLEVDAGRDRRAARTPCPGGSAGRVLDEIARAQNGRRHAGIPATSHMPPAGERIGGHCGGMPEVAVVKEDVTALGVQRYLTGQVLETERHRLWWRLVGVATEGGRSPGDDGTVDVLVGRRRRPTVTARNDS